MIPSILALAASLAPFQTAAQAHDHWVNGEPVPPWVKAGFADTPARRGQTPEAPISIGLPDESARQSR
jgi:hypothetical protein